MPKGILGALLEKVGAKPARGAAGAAASQPVK
jgi:hypothetical protein